MDAIMCDYPGCTKPADFQQDKSTTPEGYHKYWCEEHDTQGRKVPRPPEPIVIERVVKVKEPLTQADITRILMGREPKQHPDG